MCVCINVHRRLLYVCVCMCVGVCASVDCVSVCVWGVCMCV